MKARDSLVLERCVETGIRLGLNRARKHAVHKAPTEDEVVEAILRAVMHEAGEWFVFEEDRA
jgi:hypothetical protein